MVYAPDVAADGRYLANVAWTRSELAVPLRHGGKVIGVLDLQSDEPDAFDERARRIIAAFAERAEMALANARLVARLEQARQLAEDSSRLKSEFLANTSHELRTPLTAILGALNLVVNDECDTPEEKARFTRIAYDSARNLLSIVNDLLDIARIEAGKMVVRPEAVSLAALLGDVYLLMWATAEAKGLALEMDLPGPEVQVWADPEKLKQILINLVGNALKFTERGRVRVQGRALERRAEIAVSDTGIGIPLEKQAHLFEPFVQADGTTTRRYGGTGLGLSISRRLAELMGGVLSLHSAGLGQGSTFRLTLPLLDGEPSPAA
jgi:signal transduction histidine kinase